MRPKPPTKPVIVKAVPQSVIHKRASSVDGNRSKGFILNKKSSIVGSKSSIIQNLLFEDVPLAVKQAYLNQLEQQINDLNELKQQLENNIQKKNQLNQIQQHQNSFKQEVQNLRSSFKPNLEILQTSMLLQGQSEQQLVDKDLIEISYLKDLEEYQKRSLVSSNKFMAFENEFL